MSIDYAKMQREFPKQKRALTLAKKKGYAAVIASTQKTVQEWGDTGAWPDDWAHWQRALDDAYSAERQRYVRGEIDEIPAPVRIEEL